MIEKITGILRDYQQDSVDKVNLWLSKGMKNLLIQQPTGAGKSLIIAYLTALFKSQGKNILFVAHKIELLDQMYHHIHRWLEFPPVFFNKRGYTPDSEITITSIQAWAYHHKRGKHNLPKADVVIIDECHHCASNSYTNLFDYYSDAIKLGFTATPKRLDNKGLKYFVNTGNNKTVKGFEVLIKGVHVAELIERGYLTPYKIFVPESIIKIDSTNAHQLLNKSGTDYSEHKLEKFVRNYISPDEVVQAYMQYAMGKKCVLYPVSVQLAYEYAEAFKRAGIGCGVIEAKTPKTQRKQILQDFRDGKIKVLSQHSIIIEGVDVPDIECVQIIRPTKSLVVWWQSIGRALRPAPDKEYAIVIDHTTNHLDLAMPDHPKQWSLNPDSYNGLSEHLVCENGVNSRGNPCNHRWKPSADRELLRFEEVDRYTEDGKLYREGIIHQAHCRKCDHIADHQWTIITDVNSKGEREPKIGVPQEVGEIDPNKPQKKYIKIIDGMLGFAKKRGHKPSWVAFRLQELYKDMVYGDFVYLGKKLGYKPSWASYQYERYCNNLRQLEIDFDEVA